MNTRSPRLPLALLTILVVFAAAAPAAAIQVTRGAREVTAVYAQLHRAGLRVTIARPFTLRSDAATVVQSIFPPAGTSVRRGATVKLTVSCCRRTTTRVAPTASLLPSLLGYGASTANTWAARVTDVSSSPWAGCGRAAHPSCSITIWLAVSRPPRAEC
jgi:beta-lactam-binding protein with PASTA domain